MTKLALALNVAQQNKALEWLDRIGNRVDCYKLQMDLFGRAGPGLVREFVRRGASVFLDLKFHDIPTVVADAVSAAADMQVSLLTVHATGGTKMLEAAAEASHKAGSGRPLVIAVTVLTSLDELELYRVFGFSGTVRERALALAQLAKASGCDGIVCSAQELSSIKAECGRNFLAVCPGIRLAETRKQSVSGPPDDQARIGTAQQAVADGADYIVVGRPIYRAKDPLATIAEIRKQMERTK
ncbi:MAG: orotidine-5'-phosphate decarboxylase [candidate division WOR-3 bacterium]